MTSLQALRSDLLELNQSLIQIMNKRRELVSKIQELKKSSSNYDPERELFVFSSLREELKGLSPRELLAFSLLVESHAETEEGKYPHFFTGDINSNLNPNLKSILLAFD